MNMDTPTVQLSTTNAASAELKAKKSVALSGVSAGKTALCTVGRNGGSNGQICAQFRPLAGATT